MESSIKIAGINFIFNGLKYHETKVFPGCGDIYGCAIKRMSKNRYKVYIIVSWDAAELECNSLKESCAMVQRYYNKYGTFIPGAGEKESL